MNRVVNKAKKMIIREVYHEYFVGIAKGTRLNMHECTPVSFHHHRERER